MSELKEQRYIIEIAKVQGVQKRQKICLFPSRPLVNF